MSTATLLDKKADTARIEAGKLMLECRKRVEAGEAGDDYKTDFWSWFGVYVKGRSRKDAEKVMRLASAPDPMAAAAEERRKARESMAEMRKQRGANVSSNAAAYVSGKKREKTEREVQSYDSQVKDYIQAIKSFDKATTVALTALRKFSPEARPFTIRKLKAALANADKLITALGAVEVEVEVEQHGEHVNGANGKAAA